MRIVALVGRGLVRRGAGWDGDEGGGWWLGRKLGQYTAGVKAVPAIFCWHLFSSLTNHLGLLGLLARFI